MNIFKFDFNNQVHSEQSKYLRIAETIADYITERKIPAGTRLPSERQLAGEAGVTCVTINRSLNELADRGLLIRRVGSGTYVAGKENKCNIGVVCDRPFSFSDYYTGQVLDIFNRYWLQSADLIYMIAPPEDYDKLIEKHRLAGLFILSVQENSVPAILALQKRKFPVVTIGAAIESLSSISFGTNHQESCRKAVFYLKEHQCKRIAMLSCENTNTAVLERERGYTKAMYEAGLPLDPDWIIRKKSPQENLPEKHIQTLLQRNDRPDAFLLVTYHDIIPFYKLMNKLKLSIPRDVSVIGFDDPQYAATMTPPLTVLRQPIEEITKQAALQLENQIRRHQIHKFPDCTSILVERSSCLPLP